MALCLRWAGLAPAKQIAIEKNALGNDKSRQGRVDVRPYSIVPPGRTRVKRDNNGHDAPSSSASSRLFIVIILAVAAALRGVGNGVLILSISLCSIAAAAVLTFTPELDRGGVNRKCAVTEHLFR
jgi:hypothetical protein